jgi:hypothetical protein
MLLLHFYNGKYEKKQNNFSQGCKVKNLCYLLIFKSVEYNIKVREKLAMITTLSRSLLFVTLLLSHFANYI